MLNECGPCRPVAIDRQLAHKEHSAVRAAYHPSEYLDERVRMMQWWDDFLDAEDARHGGDRRTDPEANQCVAMFHDATLCVGGSIPPMPMPSPSCEDTRRR